MLGKRMSLEEIAAHLNAKKVPPIHGTNRWTASARSKGIRFLTRGVGRLENHNHPAGLLRTATLIAVGAWQQPRLSVAD